MDMLFYNEYINKIEINKFRVFNIDKFKNMLIDDIFNILNEKY